MPKEKKGKKRGNVAIQGREKKEKNATGYLCKLYHSALFVPYCPPKLGG